MYTTNAIDNPPPKRFYAACTAFAVHLIITACVAACVAFLVLKIWFPYPYADLVGGLHIFWLVVGVDVVCGPLLTAVLFNPAKPRRELTIDLSLVAIIQLGALGYGIYTLALARPVIQAFEVDRIAVVTVREIDTEQLTQAPKNLQKLPWAGVQLVGTRAPKDGDETLQSIELSMGGLEPSARPGWWQPYANNKPQIQQRMKPLADLRTKQNPAKQQAIDAAVKAAGLPIEDLFYLPFTSQKNKDSWIALLNQETKIVGYAPVGGFN